MRKFEKAERQRRNNAAVAAVLAENERQTQIALARVKARNAGLTPEQRRALAEQDIRDVWGD